MATLQLCVDDTVKAEAGALFASLGLDTSTAVRVFLTLSIENNGLPFSVCHTSKTFSLEAVDSMPGA